MHEAGFDGLQRCGSPWACPSCMVRMAAERGEELEEVVKRWGKERVAMATLTVRHAAGMPLRLMRKAVAKAWKRVQQSTRFRKLVARLGLESVRGLEATWGRENGWHPHLHVLMFFASEATSDVRDEVEDVLFVLWRAAVVRELGPACRPTRARGVKLTAATDGKYLTSLGLELTGSVFKRARDERSMSPAEIATGAADGDERCVSLWREWQKAMKGAKALSWPCKKNSRLRALRDEVREALEAKRDAALSTREMVVTIPYEVWQAVANLRCGGPLLVRQEILDVVRGGGDEEDVNNVLDDALEWLRRERAHLTGAAA